MVNDLNKLKNNKMEQVDFKTKMWIFFMKLGAITGCHQMHERSFYFGDYQFFLCARCTGILVGHIVALLSAALFFNYIYVQVNLAYFIVCAFLALLILGIDGLGQLKNRWLSNNKRRFITGLFCGFACTALLIKTIYFIIKIKR